MAERYKMDRVSIRMVHEPPLYTSEPIDTTEKAAEFIATLLQGYDREVFGTIAVDVRGVPMNFSITSIGTLDQSMVHPREVLKTAITSSAAALILFHNHPSGSVTPSQPDIQTTKRLQEVCQLVGIPVYDHIIVGSEKEYFSFREKEMMERAKPQEAYTLDDINLTTSLVADGAIRIWSDAGDVPELAQNPDLFQKAEVFQNAEPDQKPLPYHETAVEKTGKQKATYDWKAAKERREEELKNISSQLEAGIRDLFDSKAYKDYLDCLAKFPRYSLNNTLLIYQQKPDSTLCNSLTGWNKLGRRVKKGEKGIRIFAPAPYKRKIEREKKDPHTGSPVLDENGKPVMETVTIEQPAYKVVSTFDISQTSGKEIPRPGVTELTGDVTGYPILLEALRKTCPVPVTFEEISSGAKGFYHLTEDRIVIQSGMSELQTIKTLVHEMTHQRKDSLAVSKEERKDERSREVIAESVAYTVLRHWNLDPGDYSLMYIGEWSSTRDLPELRQCLQEIRDTANGIITETEVNIITIQKDRTFSREADALSKNMEMLSKDAGAISGDISKDQKTSFAEPEVPVPNQGGRIR